MTCAHQRRGSVGSRSMVRTSASRLAWSPRQTPDHINRICRLGRSLVESVIKQSSVTHMRAEILAQPAALRATIEALLPRTSEIADLAARTRQVLFFARGTSDNAAVYGSYLIQTAAGRLATLGSPSVATTYHAKVDLSGTLAVGLSPAGRTQEIIETLEL